MAHPLPSNLREVELPLIPGQSLYANFRLENGTQGQEVLFKLDEGSPQTIVPLSLLNQLGFTLIEPYLGPELTSASGHPMQIAGRIWVRITNPDQRPRQRVSSQL